MRPAVVAAVALLAGLGAGGCGDDQPSGDYDARAARACAGVDAGAQALEGDGSDVVARVKRAERAATKAARVLDHATPPRARQQAQDEAIRSLLGQSMRLRLVREQIERGSAPRVVLEAATAGLAAGDRQAAARLAGLGVSC